MKNLHSIQPQQLLVSDLDIAVLWWNQNKWLDGRNKEFRFTINNGILYTLRANNPPRLSKNFWNEGLIVGKWIAERKPQPDYTRLKYEKSA